MNMRIKTIFITILMSILIELPFCSIAATPVLHRTVKGNETVYTSTQIDEMLEGVHPTSKHIAMFIIPMNETASSTRSASYTQFELKATTNNFGTVSASAQKALYYVHSGHADVFGQSDNDKAILYINHGGTDQRSYVRISNTLTDSQITSYAPAEIIVYVDASCCWSERSDGGWLNSEDDNLTWTYVRTKNNAQEVDPGTDHCLWRPIQPVKWLSKLPAFVQ